MADTVPNVRDVDVCELIRREANRLIQQVERGETPHVEIPIRSMSNVLFGPGDRHFRLGEKTKKRKLDYSSSRAFAQLLRMLALIKGLVEDGEKASKREVYYISKNWEDAKFDEQRTSDGTLDDIEAILRTLREQLRVYPEEKGGEVAGRVEVTDRNPKTGRKIAIDCTRFGSGAYSIPASVEDLTFEVDADFILAIETAGMFQRLNDHGWWDDARCVLVSMGGVPTRACRRFIRRLSDECDLPVYGFVDGDPYGYANIYRTLKVGSANSAHINEWFCVPEARFLGVMPDDIERYGLPTHPLDATARKRAQDALDNDPFFRDSDQWIYALTRLMGMGDNGLRAEQQAFAKHGLNMVMETYLPEKLQDTDSFYA